MQLELPFGPLTNVEKPGGRKVSPLRRRMTARGEQFVLPGCGIKQLENLFFGIRFDRNRRGNGGAISPEQFATGMGCAVDRAGSNSITSAFMR